jgi:hypothetical protein
MPPYQELGLGAAPIERQQDGSGWFCRSSLREESPSGSHSGAERETAWTNSPKVQVADYGNGVNQLRLQDLVDPSCESVIAQQPAGVCGIQRPRDTSSGRTGSMHRPILPPSDPGVHLVTTAAMVAHRQAPGAVCGRLLVSCWPARVRRWWKRLARWTKRGLSRAPGLADLLKDPRALRLA